MTLSEIRQGHFIFKAFKTKTMKKPYFKLPALNQEFIKSKDYFLLFETSLCGSEDQISYIFFDPAEIISVEDPRGINRAFESIERRSKKSYIAGYFSYELGYEFERDSFKKEKTRHLINLCVFDRAVSFNHRSGKLLNAEPGLFAGSEPDNDFSVRNLRFSLSKREYIKNILRIKEYIKSGDTYQVNFTGKYDFSFEGSPYAFYRDLKEKQPVPYSAFCKFGREHVISLSPELFFRKKRDSIISRPMKGTISRGRNTDEDARNACSLRCSSKDRAENVMIVDLIRNDIGRISLSGRVKYSDMFKVERYDTLFQMTSEVKGALKKGVTMYDIFKNIYPGGSVTGAPKIRTMQIIRELEKGPREVYCGALGIIFPGRDAVFNLPIRTIYLNGARGNMGVGSGIVNDSDPLKEYNECRLKAEFLLRKKKSFCLIETMLWDGGYRFLKGHIKRLKHSSGYFGFCFNRSEIIKKLKTAEAKFIRGTSCKVRLLLDKNGNIKISASGFERKKESKPALIRISKFKTDNTDRFLCHKTTNRSLYDSEYRKYSSKGYFDVIFQNNKGEITEGCISNIIIKKNKRMFTPPVSCGLLPGVYRDYFVKRNSVREERIFKKDLEGADKIYLCNSVRGLTEVRLK